MCAYISNPSVCPKHVWMNNSRIRLKFIGGSWKREDTAPFTSKNTVNFFVVFELDTYSVDLSTDVTLKDYLFGSIKLTKTADADKYKYIAYGIGLIRVQNSDCFTFGVDMNPSVHINNNKKDTFILGKGPSQRLDDTTLTSEAHNSINFSRSNRKFCLSLHYNRSNCLLNNFLILQRYINSMQLILK